MTAAAPGELARAATRWGAVVAVAAAVVLVALDMTIVAVALPAIGTEFTAPAAAAQWVLLGYFLPLVALSIPAGRWLDRAGVRPAFLLAVGGFGVTSVLATLAPSFPLLIASRVGQGMFGSLIAVIAFPVVAAVVRPDQRGRAISLIITLVPLSGIAGPVLGGVLTDALGWRAVFVINVPIVVVAAWLGRRSLPRTAGGRVGLPRPDRRSIREAGLLGAAAVAWFVALDLLGRGSGGAVWPALLGGLGVVAVALWARLPEAEPVVRLVRRRELAGPLGSLPLMTTIFGTVGFLVPYYVITTLGGSAQLAGLTLAAIGVTMAASTPVAGALADRFGPRWLVLAGGLVSVVGVVGLLVVGGGASALALIWPLAVIGLGQGLFAGPNSADVLAATPRELAGTAGGITAVLRTFGFALGPALGALCWALTGGGSAGFRAGIAVLAIVAGLVVVVILAGQRASRGDPRAVPAASRRPNAVPAGPGRGIAANPSRGS